jgi:YD repeat-containing protein
MQGRGIRGRSLAFGAEGRFPSLGARSWPAGLRRGQMKRALGLAALALASVCVPSVSAQQLNWSPTSCYDHGCSQIPVYKDGQPAANYGDGNLNMDGFNDCQDSLITHTTRWCHCPIVTPLDDLGPTDVTSSDPSSGCDQGLKVAGNMKLGDNCGASRRDIDTPTASTCPLPCRNNESSGQSKTPVRYASGQMQTLPQVDLVVEDPFFPVRFERQYGSNFLVDNVLGWGWRHNWDIKLLDSGGSDPSFRLSNGGTSIDIAPYTRVVDNAPAAGDVYETLAAAEGPWTNSTTIVGYVGNDYLTDLNGHKGQCRATFQPYLANAGWYLLSINYTSGSDRDPNVPVTIHHADGDTLLHVNMKTGGGTWYSLGRFRFEPGNAGYVKIDNTGTSGIVIADAALFKYDELVSADGSAKLVPNAQIGGYDLLKNDGTIDHFDASVPHLLTRIENPDGRGLDFAYDPNGLLETITTPAGRVVTFSYLTSGGKPRIASIATGAQTLVNYTYTSAAVDGFDGRLKTASYPEDGSGYVYTYSPLDPLLRLLERLEDATGKLVEEHIWGTHPVTQGWVVLSSTSASEQTDFAYNTTWTALNGTKMGERKTTVTRHIDAQTTETFTAEFDEHGRVFKNTGACSSCGQSATLDLAGNAVVSTDATGRMTLSRYDNAGDRLSAVQVTVQPEQILPDSAGSDEFDSPALDGSKWQASSSGRGNTSIVEKDGLLHLEVENATFNRTARVVSRYRGCGATLTSC